MCCPLGSSDLSLKIFLNQQLIVFHTTMLIYEIHISSRRTKGAFFNGGCYDSGNIVKVKHLHKIYNIVIVFG